MTKAVMLCFQSSLGLGMSLSGIGLLLVTFLVNVHKLFYYLCHVFFKFFYSSFLNVFTSVGHFTQSVR